MEKHFHTCFKRIRIFSILIVLLTLLVFLIPILFVNFLIRSMVWGSAKVFRPDLGSFVTGSAAVFATNKMSKIPQNIISVLSINGRISLETLQSHMQERVMEAQDPVTGKLLYEGLKKSWQGFLGYAFWKMDLNFNLKNHVREYDYGGKLKLESPCTYKELHSVLGLLYEAPWDKSQSSWELLLLKDVTNEEGAPCSAIVLRINHVLADAYSIFGLYRSLTRSSFSTPEAKLSKRGFTRWEKLALLWRVPWDIAESAVDMQSWKPLKKTHGSADDPVSVTSVSPIIPVDVVKRISSHFSVSYATVMYAAALGAIERATKLTGEDVPDRLGGALILPRAGHPHKGLVVHALSGSVNLTLKAKDPVERLMKIYREQLDCLKSTVIDTAPIVCELLAFLPTYGRQLVAESVSGVMTLCVTSFPVTTSQEFYNGHEIQSMVSGLGPVAPVGMVFAITGVHNKQICQVTVDPCMLKNRKAAQNMGVFFAQEIGALAKGMDANIKFKKLL